MRLGITRLMLLAIAAAAMPSIALADWGALNMPVGVTDISRRVYGLHMTIFYICCIIGALVFGVMFYSMFKHRKSKGAVAADFHESTTVEIVWTIVPLIILIAMAVPAARVLIKMEDFSDSEMSIKVTGYQWRWSYEYIDEGISFYSQLDPEHNAARQMGSGVDLTTIENYLVEVDKPLVVPVGKKIRFLHTAADVIHSWWVPALSVKKDARRLTSLTRIVSGRKMNSSLKAKWCTARIAQGVTKSQDKGSKVCSRRSLEALSSPAMSPLMWRRS